jgi:uncharacterized membrane protein
MLDRHTSAAEGMVTSLRVAAKNPVAIAGWGLIVAVLLLLGSIPCFLGLAVVIPVLGHATWHLYRKAVEIDPNARPLPPPVHPRKPAADFPANLFPWKRRDNP